MAVFDAILLSRSAIASAMAVADIGGDMDSSQNADAAPWLRSTGAVRFTAETKPSPFLRPQGEERKKMERQIMIPARKLWILHETIQDQELVISWMESEMERLQAKIEQLQRELRRAELTAQRSHIAR